MAEPGVQATVVPSAFSSRKDRMTMGRPSRPLVGLLAGLLALAACGERNSAETGTGGRLAIATGNTTGVYYLLGGAYAQVINSHLPGYRATAEATGASVENIRRVVSGTSDIGFTLADVATDAVRGEGSFSSAQPIRALARVHSNYTQVVVRTDSGINRIEDMRGKTVSTGSPNSGTEVLAVRLLRVAGLNPDRDINRQRLALPETTGGVRSGAIQAMFWSGGLPTPGLRDLFASAKGKVKLLDLAPYLPRIQAQYNNLYSRAMIGRVSYGTAANVTTISVPNLLVVRDTMSDELAYKLVALLFAYQDDLVKVHPDARSIELRTAQETGEVVLHSGAKRYYSEHPGSTP
jgi:TRAP transporter TAXI family solute receptor